MLTDLIQPVWRKLRWLYAPDLLAAGYAIRTTLTSLLALGIALWMELGSPQWAALTVWMVAQRTPGRSRAKARWHFLGMVVGSLCAVGLVASCAQAPLMFIVLLSLGIGLFCFLGIFMPGPAIMTNYRIHGLRATGFTYVIVALDGIADPDHIFSILAARVTYITLGIVLESGISSLFQPRLTQRTRQTLVSNFEASLTPSLKLVASLLEQRAISSREIRDLLLAVSSFRDQVEFAEVELRYRDRSGDHARAALGKIVVFICAALDFAALSKTLETIDEKTARSIQTMKTLMAEIPGIYGSFNKTSAFLSAMEAHRQSCDSFTGYDLGAEGMQSCILQNKILLMTQTLHDIIEHFQKSNVPIANDRFRSPIMRTRYWFQAIKSSSCAFLTVLFSGIIWMATAWPGGPVFMTFVATVCSLFALLDDPVTAMRAFLRGGCFAAFVAGILNLVLLPGAETIEMLSVWYGIAALLGGMALVNKSTAGLAVSYSLILPIMMSPSNQGRIDELEYFNMTLALLLGIFFPAVVFRVVLPIDVDHQRKALRKESMNDLYQQANANRNYPVGFMVYRNIDRLTRIMSYQSRTSVKESEHDVEFEINMMCISLNLRNLHQINDQLRRRSHNPTIISGYLAQMRRFSQYPRVYLNDIIQSVHKTSLALRHLTEEATQAVDQVALINAVSSLETIAVEFDLIRKNIVEEV